MLTVRPLMPGGWAHSPSRKRPGCAADTPQLVTSSTCQRQWLSRCSRQRVPQREIRLTEKRGDA